jgi:methionine-R-sulfoxide reductase
MGEISKTEAEWKASLSKERYKVLRLKGTERPFTGELLYNKETGVYTCGGCGAELFESKQKYDSGSGWPSFMAPISEGRITEKEDRTIGMRRTEILCSRCGGHLGHVFNDGPAPTRRRYCVNSLSLDFMKSDQE